MRTIRKRAQGRLLRVLTTTLVLTMFAALLLAGTALAAAPGKPTAKAPKGTIATAAPTFTWSKASGAAKYELRAYRGGKQVLKKAGITKLSWKSSGALPTDVSLTWKVRASNARGAGAWSKSLAFKVTVASPIKIGDVYQGGKVAYILQPWPNLDPGYVPGETHGLIAAAADQSPGIAWSDIQSIRVGLTGTAIGTGQANTTRIVAQGCTSGAALLCDQLVEGGHSDWYLPSQDELNKLYINQAAIGGFVSVWSAGSDYWSSSEYGADDVWDQSFDSGVSYLNSKGSAYRVRAVRSF